MSKLSDLQFLWLILPILEAEHGYASSLPTSDQNQIISNKNQRLKNSTKKAHGSRWVVRQTISNDSTFNNDLLNFKSSAWIPHRVSFQFPRVPSREATAAGSLCHFIWYLCYWLLCCRGKNNEALSFFLYTKGTKKIEMNSFKKNLVGGTRMSCQ